MKLDNYIRGQIILVKHLHTKALPGSTQEELNHAIKLTKKGILKADGLFEVALATRSNLKHTPVFHKDFSDGSDAKTAVSFQDGNCRKAKISNIKTKIGNLRIIISCPITSNVYYFKIPKSAYKNQVTISIRFKLNGAPNFGKWAKYQVKTWRELTH